MSDSLTLNDIFKHGGVLAESFTGYQERAAQTEMAQAVLNAINDEKTLVVEAGTGTGKTFAYLIPALISGKKVLISTGTKTLQDQLFLRDLPKVIKLLGRKVHKALLKGRANYLCLHRLEQSYEEGRFANKRRVNELVAVKQWAASTRSGDIAECTAIEERSPIIPYVTSTTDNCLGSECDLYEECFLMKARRKAHKADIIVINHHLFFADQAVKERADTELLPKPEVVIFDEAHQIPEIATQFLGEFFSSRQLTLFINDYKLVIAKDAPDKTDFVDILEQLITHSTTIFNAFGQNSRNAFAHIRHKPALKNALQSLGELLQDIVKLAKPLAVRSKDLEVCWQRAMALQESFERLTAATPDNQIHWYELTKQHFRLHLTPISIRERMQDIIQFTAKSWVFTSATIATSKSDFSLFNNELGMKPDKKLKLDSPFDFASQTLLYLPNGLPEPKNPDYVRAMIKEVIPVLKASRGRAFVLFTSYRAMYEAYDLLSQHSSFHLVIQGKTGKAQLLDQFRSLDNCVLLGTSSFWEGVDVRGEDLSCVVIDKLPFSVPDEPIIKARIDSLRKAGKDPFADYQLPRAVLSLKQGAGRLIRDVTDTGVLMLCDPRLQSAHYGKTFLGSLPPMPRTSKLADVQSFFAQLTEAVT